MAAHWSPGTGSTLQTNGEGHTAEFELRLIASNYSITKDYSIYKNCLPLAYVLRILGNFCGITICSAQYISERVLGNSAKLVIFFSRHRFLELCVELFLTNDVKRIRLKLRNSQRRTAIYYMFGPTKGARY